MTDKSTVPVRTATVAPQDIFEGLRRNVDRLFDEFGGFGVLAPAMPRMSPRLDVTDTDGVIEITAELPGLEEKDVEVSVADGVLTLSGEKKSDSERKDKNYVYAERSYGAFTRRVPLPAGVDPNSIKATMKKGVLSLTIAKPAAPKATKIEIHPAA